MPSVAETDWLMGVTGARAREFYTVIGVELPDRQGDELPIRCFANAQAHTNGDRRPSASVNMLTGLWHCQSCGAKGNAYQAAMIRGYLEADARRLAQEHGLFLETEKPKLPGERQLKKWRADLVSSQMLIRRLWEVKGWTPQAIVRCGLGWDGERITFPIRSQKLKIVGVVRYLPGGDPKSKAMTGSKRLLFPAPEITVRSKPLFVVEGEPDAVSVWSCGHQAVAIPGTGSWRAENVLRLAGRQVIMLADCDPQGRALAHRVTSEVRHSRWVDLEPSRNDGYDIGDWVLAASKDGGLGQMHDLLGRLAA